MIFVNLWHIGILNIKHSDYCFIIRLISKNKAMKLMENKDLTEKSEI